MIFCAMVPQRFQMAMAVEDLMPNWDRKSITARMPNIRPSSSRSFSHLAGEMPCTSVRRCGSFSSTFKVSSPNCATIREASTGPMPLMAPEARYRRMAEAVAGSCCSAATALNWVP